MISPETIALVKERTDLVALIGETVKLTRRGRSFTGLCPFHKEKTPSFHVSPDRGFFHCFGCKESGSAVDFLMKALGLSFQESITMLAERAGVPIEEVRGGAAEREATAARRAKDDLYAVNQLAATYYEQCLYGGKLPLARYAFEELARRGLDPRGRESGETLDPVLHALQAFRIGYAPYGWDGLTTYLRTQGVSPVAAEKVGLLVPRQSGGGYYDRFRHRLMFAVVDVLGRVVAWSARALADPSEEELAAEGLSPERRDGPPAKYVNSPESPIYTKGEHLFGLHQARQAIRQKGHAILVEGNFDVVALHARGLSNVAAPLGTAFTEAQAKLLKRFAPEVVLLFDGDAAGRKATRAARGAVRAGGLSARAATLPAGKDPDDLVRERGPAALEQLVTSAPGLFEYLLQDALDAQAFTGASLEEQLARLRAVAALLAEEDDPTRRQMAKTYADRLAEKFVVRGKAAVDLRELERLVEQAVARGPQAAPQGEVSGPTASPDHGPRARSRNLTPRIALDMLGALFDFPELLEHPEVTVALEGLEGDAAMAALVLRRMHVSGVWDTSEYVAAIPPSIRPFAQGRLSAPELETAESAKLSLIENGKKLRGLSLDRARAVTVEELERADALGDVASVEALLREQDRRARERRGLR